MDWELWGLRAGAFFGIFFCTVTFGLLPLLIQRYIASDDLRDRLLSLGNSFAGGLFLGGGFVHLLGEASATLSSELGETYDSYPLAMILAPLGFLGAFFIEKVMLSDCHMSSSKKKAYNDVDEERPYGTFSESRDSTLSVPETHAHHGGHVVGDEGIMPQSPVTHTIASVSKRMSVQAQKHVHVHDDHVHLHQGSDHDDHDHANMMALIEEPNSLLPYLLVIILSFHSIFSGLAVGVQREVSSGLPVFAAIVSHKWIEAFALGVSLLRARASLWTCLKLVTFFSLTTPAGIVLGVALAEVVDGSAGNIVTAIFTALAAGTFIYVAVVDILVPEFASSRDKWVRAGLVFLGMSVITALIFAFEDHGHGNDEELDHDH